MSHRPTLTAEQKHANDERQKAEFQASFVPPAQCGVLTHDAVDKAAAWDAVAAARADERRKTIEQCAEVAEAQVKEFLSPQYAANQPFGSVCERFACAEVAKAIRALSLPETAKGREWQDISTAPKDGRTIEVRYVNDDPRRVRWSQSGHGSGWHLVDSSGAFILRFDPTQWRPASSVPSADRGSK